MCVRVLVVQNHVDLDNMRSDRTYSVEVQAVSFWGQTPLKGPRAIIHFSTQQSTSSHTAQAFTVCVALVKLQRMLHGLQPKPVVRSKIPNC